MSRIKDLRKERKMTQTELARRAGVSQPHIHDLENGHRHASPETLERIAAALGVPIDALAKEEEEKRAGR